MSGASEPQKLTCRMEELLDESAEEELGCEYARALGPVVLAQREVLGRQPVRSRAPLPKSPPRLLVRLWLRLWGRVRAPLSQWARESAGCLDRLLVGSAVVWACCWEEYLEAGTPGSLRSPEKPQ